MGNTFTYVCVHFDRLTENMKDGEEKRERDWAN